MQSRDMSNCHDNIQEDVKNNNSILVNKWFVYIFMQLILQRTAIRLVGVLSYLKTTVAPSLLAENVHGMLSASAFSSSFSLQIYIACSNNP